MRQLQYLGVFRRDLKKLVRSGRYRLNEIDDVVESLRRDQPLAKRYHDHALSGNWKDHRECHIKPVLPRWFGNQTPVLDALLHGLAATARHAHRLIEYARLQTRLQTATGGW